MFGPATVVVSGSTSRTRERYQPAQTRASRIAFTSLQLLASNVGQRGFCADCGSPLVMLYTSFPETIWINVGTLDDPNVARDFPTFHSGIESEIPWLTIHDDPPRNRCDDVAIYDEVGLVLDEDAD